jgi:alpha/beta superfamily hydrolase
MAATLQPHFTPKPHSIHSYAGLARPPHISRLERVAQKTGPIESLSIDVDDAKGGFVPGFLHLPADFTNQDTAATPQQPPPHHRTSGSADLLSHAQQENPRLTRSPAPGSSATPDRTAVLLLSGAGGGVTGPSSIFLSAACKLATLGRGVPALRLDYRYPSDVAACVADARAGMAYLRDLYGLERFVLVGWSFGGSVVFSAAEEDERVVGCVAVGSHAAGAEGIEKLRPRPVLLMHGSGDNTASVGCAQRLWHMYGDGDRMLQVFEGDDHSLSRNAERAEEMLCEFVARCAGIRVGERERREVVGVELVEDGERRELMERGGDLRAPERED